MGAFALRGGALFLEVDVSRRSWRVDPLLLGGGVILPAGIFKSMLKKHYI